MSILLYCYVMENVTANVANAAKAILWQTNESSHFNIDFVCHIT